MAHVITGRCMGERYAACVEVCPVDSMHFGDHEGSPMMVIDPETCISCGACLPECPVEAIVSAEEEAPEWAEYNRAAAALWPNAASNPSAWAPRDPSGPPQSQTVLA